MTDKKILMTAHRMGQFALYGDAERYISKEAMVSLIGAENIEKYNPLFDYVDKNDNKKRICDGYIDLASFANIDLLEIENQKDVNVTEGYFSSNKGLKGLGELFKLNTSEIVAFFYALFSIQSRDNARWNIELNADKTNAEKVSNTQTTKILNNDNTISIIKTHNDNSTEENVYDKENKILQTIFKNNNKRLIERVEYIYKDNLLVEKIHYNEDYKADSKTIYKYKMFKSEAEMLDYQTKMMQNSVSDGGIEIISNNSDNYILMEFEEFEIE